MVEFYLKIIFALSLSILFYTYIGYPAMIYALSLIFPFRHNKGFIEPGVTILITAYNEEKDIREKIENTLAIEYPKEKLEIIVASDGSTDSTDQIVGEFSARGVKLFRQEGRVGKTVTQNNAIAATKGEIVLFSDATTMLKPDVLRKILPNFADERIGCVAGKLIYVDKKGSDVGTGARGYWNYETWIKQSESRFCSMIGVSGCLYAVRREAYVPMYAEACSDFLIVSLVYENGQKTIFEPEAICYEETNVNTDKEMQMRIRVIAQSLVDIWRAKRLLNPFKTGFFALELFSHKILRYAIPFFLFVCFFSAAFLASNSLFWAGIFGIQAAFYLIALGGRLLEGIGMKLGIFSMPLYFCLANSASLIALFRIIRGERVAAWEPIREPVSNEGGELNSEKHLRPDF